MAKVNAAAFVRSALALFIILAPGVGVGVGVGSSAQPAPAESLPGNPRVIAVEQVRLHYIEKGEGEPMILVHGTLQDYTSWLPNFDFFADRYRVLAYSRRYDWPNENPWRSEPKNYSARTDARDLAELIETLELGPAHVIGHSYGGLVSLILALERPDLIRSLILTELPLAPEPFGLSELPGRDRFPEFAELMHGGKDREAVESLLEDALGEETVRQFPEAMWEPIMRNVVEFRALVNSSDPFPIVTPAELGELRRPTLTVIGEKSIGTPFESFADALVQHISGAESVTIPGASHAMWFENADQARQAVISFLDRWSHR